MWALTNFDQGRLGLLLVFSGGGGQSDRFRMSRMVVSPTEMPSFLSSPKMRL